MGSDSMSNEQPVRAACPDSEPHPAHQWRGFAGGAGCVCPGKPVSTIGTPDPGEVQVDSPHFIDARHCLYVGWVMGIAMKHGFDITPETDENGYTNRIRISMKPYADAITVLIPYPPDDWTL